MKRITLLGFGLLGLWMLNAFTAKTVLQNILVSFRGLTIQAGATIIDIIQGVKPLVLSVEVTNTQQVGVRVNAFTGTASVNGEPVGQINYALNTSLPAGQTVLIDIPILLDSEALLNAAGQSLADKALPPIQIDGDIVANTFTFPVHEVFTY